MAVTIDEIQVKFGAEIDELQKRLKTVEGELKQTGRQANKMGAATKALAGIAIAAFAAMSAAAMKFAKDAVGSFITFEKSLSNLKAITGATTEDMRFYEIQARAIGKTTTLSASEAAEAFKLIGSAKPELLQARDALAQVTKEAVTLAEAAGMDLPDAARALGITLNSLQLDVSETSRVINVLAASSQKGAKEIPFVADALSKFGGTARAAGIDIETSVAAIQELGKAIPEASLVGTALRGVIVRLQQEAAKAKRPFEGLVEELERLKPIQGDINALLKIFGREQLLAAQTLLANTESLKTLRANITDTNTAYEQAAINTDNLDGRIKALKSAYESLGITVGQMTDGPLNRFIIKLTEATRNFERMITGIEQSAENEALQNFGKYLQEIGVNLSNIATSNDIAQNIDKVTERIIAERKRLETAERTLSEIEKRRGTTLNPDELRDLNKRREIVRELVGDARGNLQALTDTLDKLMQMKPQGRATIVDDLETTLSGANEEAADLQRMLRALALQSSVEIDLSVHEFSQTARKATVRGDALTQMMDELHASIQEVPEPVADASEILAEFNENMMVAQNIAFLVSDSMHHLFSTIASGGNILENFGRYLKQLAGQLAAMAATALILTAITGGKSKIASTLGGMFGTDFSTILKSMILGTSPTPMASGGIAYGPTNALIGEYPGARSNPEVVAPLNKLQGMLAGMNGGGTVVFEIAGNNLRGVLDRNDRRQFRTA